MHDAVKDAYSIVRHPEFPDPNPFENFPFPRNFLDHFAAEDEGELVKQFIGLYRNMLEKFMHPDRDPILDSSNLGSINAAAHEIASIPDEEIIELFRSHASARRSVTDASIDSIYAVAEALNLERRKYESAHSNLVKDTTSFIGRAVQRFMLEEAQIIDFDIPVVLPDETLPERIAKCMAGKGAYGDEIRTGINFEKFILGNEANPFEIIPSDPSLLRTILSHGTDALRAYCNALRRVMLPLFHPDPLRGDYKTESFHQAAVAFDKIVAITDDELKILAESYLRRQSKEMREAFGKAIAELQTVRRSLEEVQTEYERTVKTAQTIADRFIQMKAISVHNFESFQILSEYVFVAPKQGFLLGGGEKSDLMLLFDQRGLVYGRPIDPLNARTSIKEGTGMKSLTEDFENEVIDVEAFKPFGIVFGMTSRLFRQGPDLVRPEKIGGVEISDIASNLEYPATTDAHMAMRVEHFRKWAATERQTPRLVCFTNLSECGVFVINTQEGYKLSEAPLQRKALLGLAQIILDRECRSSTERKYQWKDLVLEQEGELYKLSFYNYESQKIETVVLNDSNSKKVAKELARLQPASPLKSIYHQLKTYFNEQPKGTTEVCKGNYKVTLKGNLKDKMQLDWEFTVHGYPRPESNPIPINYLMNNPTILEDQKITHRVIAKFAETIQETFLTKYDISVRNKKKNAERKKAEQNKK